MESTGQAAGDIQLQRQARLDWEKRAQRWLSAHQEELITRLDQFLRFPSISALPEHAADVQAAAVYLGGELQRLGFPRVQIIPTEGHPLVYAEWLGNPSAPTALVYGHYDVQPVDPLSEWHSDPFVPTRSHDGRLLSARGASDDKGPIWAHLSALEALIRTAPRPGRPAEFAASSAASAASAAWSPLPVNLKVLLEGEEEVSSRHLIEYVHQHGPELSCDLVVISDTTLYAPGIPAICYGLRGIVASQVDVFGPDQDVHSGSYGGVVANPAHELSRLIASFHNEQGQVDVDGFYDDVRPLTAAERQMWANLPFDPATIQRETGAPALWSGESEYTPLERLWARPTLEVNGLWSGYQGSGTKTIIPATAHAKITCRLVPDQDPAHVLDALEAAVHQRLPASVRARFTRLQGGRAWITDPNSAPLRKAAEALTYGFGAPTVFVRMGGSIPVVSSFAEVLRKPVVLMGLSLSGENAHAPNEFVTLPNLQAGMRALVRYWLSLGEESGLPADSPVSS